MLCVQESEIMMSRWKYRKWISSHFTAWIFLVSSEFCRFWSRRRLNAASAGSHPFLSSRARSCSYTPLFHNPSTLTCCLGLFKVIGSCPSSLLGQLGSEVSDLCLIGRNGMVIVALCCHSGDNKGRDFTVNSARAQKNVIYLSPRLWRFCAEALIILLWFFCWVKHLHLEALVIQSLWHNFYKNVSNHSEYRLGDVRWCVISLIAPGLWPLTSRPPLLGDRSISYGGSGCGVTA